MKLSEIPKRIEHLYMPCHSCGIHLSAFRVRIEREGYVMNACLCEACINLDQETIVEQVLHPKKVLTRMLRDGTNG